MLELTDSLKQVLRETADKLKGSDRRRFIDILYQPNLESA
jgi:hypothetical protein